MLLPQKISSCFDILAGNDNLRRYVEWHGFVMEKSRPGFLTMRRDFSDGVFSHYPKPPYPLALRRLH